ncbi:hypothetical protein M514_13917 [Trichuris suis]|uniref:Uncharacterized protein n=1 Tax=Trichuris suis TaxID=68888 RepID=A0A085MQR0_9BILA|nr:hypothetical protein M513_13917 [Trichuris suis]KFD59556.1 hypothetical protein M514_13917 [Trichuris suis]
MQASRHAPRVLQKILHCAESAYLRCYHKIYARCTLVRRSFNLIGFIEKNTLAKYAHGEASVGRRANEAKRQILTAILSLLSRSESDISEPIRDVTQLIVKSGVRDEARLLGISSTAQREKDQTSKDQPRHKPTLKEY